MRGLKSRYGRQILLQLLLFLVLHLTAVPQQPLFQHLIQAHGRLIVGML